MTRDQYRSAAKAKLANLSTNLPDIFPDSEINTAFLQTLRSLPYKGVYKEEKWYRTLTQNTKEYGVETGTLKIEKVELDQGTGGVENYNKVMGWEVFANTLHLPFYPGGGETLRVWAKMKFTDVTDDTTTIEVPDDQGEIITLGMVRRLLENLISYMIDSANYDSLIKPSGATLPQVKNWRDELRVEEERIIKSFRTPPRTREIDLVG